jgi:putative PIN family toxin of toxin-antitoxin system
MIFIQALASDKGPSNACLQLVRDDKVELCVSPEILAEIRDVLGRPKLRKKLPSLTADRVAVFLEDVASLANIVIDVPARFHYERDPKDEPYINLAIFAKARYLASRDRDILDLAEDESFRSQFPELTIIDPVTFLRVVAPVENQPE